MTSLKASSTSHEDVCPCSHGHAGQHVKLAKQVGVAGQHSHSSGRMQGPRFSGNDLMQTSSRWSHAVHVVQLVQTRSVRELLQIAVPFDKHLLAGGRLARLIDPDTHQDGNGRERPSSHL